MRSKGLDEHRKTWFFLFRAPAAFTARPQLTRDESARNDGCQIWGPAN
jgi:hypothetical protein